MATTAAANIAGAHFAGEFHDYITAERRPQFSPALKNASSCVALIDFDRDPELAIETTERLHQIFLKKIGIIGVGAKLDAGILLRAVRNGCTEFLTKPVSLVDLIGIAQPLQRGTGRRSQRAEQPGPRDLVFRGEGRRRDHHAGGPSGHFSGPPARQEGTADRPQAAAWPRCAVSWAEGHAVPLRRAVAQRRPAGLRAAERLYRPPPKRPRCHCVA